MSGNEKKYVQKAFDQNWVSTVGPNLDSLEENFSLLTGKPSVALGSGTAGIHLGLKLLGVQSGDEVIVPTLTFAGGCNPICYEGGIPIFLDSEKKSWNLDPELLSEFLIKRANHNRLPKAVIVAHLFGQAANLNEIVDICNKYELPLLEDAAESLGAEYNGSHPGTFGDVGVYSFNGNKIITASSGGMLVAKKKSHIEKARKWSMHSRDLDPNGINNYIHSELGYNYRLSNVLAGIALGQLEVLKERVSQRQAVFRRYKDSLLEFDGINAQEEILEGSHTRWLSCFLIEENKCGFSASELIRHLINANIEARPVWKPMHEQKLYQQFERIGGDVASDLNRRGICLPSSSSLSEMEQDFILAKIAELYKNSKSR